METASTVILDALQLIVVQASEAPIEADEAQTALRQMNRMMARFDAEGISLGYTSVTSLGDTVTVADGALDGVVYNLAIALAPYYEVPVSLEIAKVARDGKEAMRALSFRLDPVQLPGNLPVGSGNQGCTTRNNTFFVGHQPNVSTETNRNILLEDDTDTDI